MRSGEHWNDYPPDDPPEGEHYCSVCGYWDEDCSCSDEPESAPKIIENSSCQSAAD